MTDRYEKLHVDDAARSRILKTIESADLNEYRDRPEFIVKERPELASIGEPSAQGTRARSQEALRSRKGFSRRMTGFLTIAAAAALTILIAVPLIRINSGKGQMSGTSQMAAEAKASGETENQYDTAANMGEYAEAEAAVPLSSIPSDAVIAAFRNYYGEAYSVEREEETTETLRLTVTRNTADSSKETLTVMVDLLTGETVTLDEAGSQLETGTVSVDGVYTARS